MNKNELLSDYRKKECMGFIHGQLFMAMNIFFNFLNEEEEKMKDTEDNDSSEVKKDLRF